MAAYRAANCKQNPDQQRMPAESSEDSARQGFGRAGHVTLQSKTPSCSVCICTHVDVNIVLTNIRVYRASRVGRSVHRHLQHFDSLMATAAASGLY